MSASSSCNRLLVALLLVHRIAVARGLEPQVQKAEVARLQHSALQPMLHTSRVGRCLPFEL